MLRVEVTREADWWVLTETFTYADGQHLLCIPAGFRFDLASIPRPLWWLIAPFELSLAAPLIHDFLYRYRGSLPQGSCNPNKHYTRADADALFRDVMQREGVTRWRRTLAYAAVRAAGGISW